MEEVDVQDDSKSREAIEQPDGKISPKDMEKIELRSDDSFEVISISCTESSRNSGSGDSDEEAALVISIRDSMNKSFPEVQLVSDLVKSTPSFITLTAENDLADDKCISPEVGFAPEDKYESCCDNVVPSFSRDDQISSIIQLQEHSEKHEPALNIEHTPLFPSHTTQGHYGGSLLQLNKAKSTLNFHDEPSSVVSNPADMYERPSTSTSMPVYSDVNKTKEYPLLVKSHKEDNLHSNPQKLQSIFVEQQFENHAQLSGSASGIQEQGSDVVNSTDGKDSPAKNVMSVGHLPNVQNSATGLWGWLCPKSLLHKLIDKAWASIDAVINTLDPQMKNACVKPDFEILIAATSDFESLPIRKAFRRTFLEKVGVASLTVTLGCIPAQPVGFNSGLCCAESRIKFMREHKLVEKNKIIVATSPVLVELTPLRWHHTTCLMLDDPHLGLTLHTFTQPVPVPNIYVDQVQLRTPSDYHLKHLGFNVTVGRVISIMTGWPENDWQYAMTGTSFNKILESAAVVLIGMYKSYLTGVSY